jgi:hypothetical protein
MATTQRTTCGTTPPTAWIIRKTKRIASAGPLGYTYTCDADGNRVEKSNGSAGTIYWSMSPGIVAESDLGGNLTSEYVFFGGRRTARKDFPSGAVSYYFSDELKTTGLMYRSSPSLGTRFHNHVRWHFITDNKRREEVGMLQSLK